MLRREFNMETGAKDQGNLKDRPASVAQIAADVSVSKAWKDGRRVRLYFTSEEPPILHRVEYQFKGSSEVQFRQQGHIERSFQWRVVPRALSLIFLEYSIWAKKGRNSEYYFDGQERRDFAKSLGDAIETPSRNILGVFVEKAGFRCAYHSALIFGGLNRAGGARDNRERRITINPDFLPPECVEIYWNIRGELPLRKLYDLEALAKSFRKSLSIPEPRTKEVEPPTESPEKAPTSQERKSATKPHQQSATELFRLREETPKKEPGHVVQPPPPFTAKEFTDPRSEKPAAPADLETPVGAFVLKPRAEKKRYTFPIPPADLSIDPALFEIQNPYGEEWYDSEVLINFGDPENEADAWKTRDACEGVLIFGAVGSGKTSGSGAAFAMPFLRAGFGCLVMTAKPGEAERWIRLCNESGRAGDCVHVTPTSGHKLNILEYEATRPGERISMADDLIALFRCLLAVMSRSKGKSLQDEFWTNSTNELLRLLFQVFAAAREQLSMTNFAKFVTRAPDNPDKAWERCEYFAEILERAWENAQNGTDDDKEDFNAIYDYWVTRYPNIPLETRGGIVTGFQAMASVLGSRGIREALCGETNLTPEMILSGKVVILDCPVKESNQSGLMIQAAWKLLLQQAIERRSDKGKTSARPVVIWEDEGHEFFSEHDVRFQPTARDCRAVHVIISQNIHNFLHLGHDQHAVFAVFAAMNTYVLHSNNDTETNTWASKTIGTVRKLKMRSSGSVLRPWKAKDISLDLLSEPENPGFGFTVEEDEKLAIPPADFGKLKRGGDGTCEAIVVWLSHQFAINENRNYCSVTFSQEPRI